MAHFDEAQLTCLLSGERLRISHSAPLPNQVVSTSDGEINFLEENTVVSVRRPWVRSPKLDLLSAGHYGSLTAPLAALHPG